MGMSLSNSVQRLLIAQAIKAALKDAQVNQPLSDNSVKNADSLTHWKRNLKPGPVICYTHKLQFKNRREFRLHIKYQHNTEQI